MAGGSSRKRGRRPRSGLGHLAFPMHIGRSRNAVRPAGRKAVSIRDLAAALPVPSDLHRIASRSSQRPPGSGTGTASSRGTPRSSPCCTSRSDLTVPVFAASQPWDPSWDRTRNALPQAGCPRLSRSQLPIYAAAPRSCPRRGRTDIRETRRSPCSDASRLDFGGVRAAPTSKCRLSGP